MGFRNAAGYGLIASTIGFVFVSVGGAGLIANLAKNIIGRARPKLFDTIGPLDFQLFAFDPDHASFPSGPCDQHLRSRHRDRHALAAGEVLLYTIAAWIAASRVLIGQHYFTDVVAGRDARHGFSLSRARAICRAPLAVRAHAAWRLPVAREPHAKLARLARAFALEDISAMSRLFGNSGADLPGIEGD